jgi:hypothetical protein
MKYYLFFLFLFGTFFGFSQNIQIENYTWNYELDPFYHPSNSFSENGHWINWECNQEPTDVYLRTTGSVYNSANTTKKVKINVSYYLTPLNGSPWIVYSHTYPILNVPANSSVGFADYGLGNSIAQYTHGMAISVKVRALGLFNNDLDSKTDYFNFFDGEIEFDGLSIENSNYISSNRYWICSADALITNLINIDGCIDNLTYKVETLSSNWQSVTGTYVPNTTVAYTGQSQINLSSTSFAPGKYRMTVSAAYNSQTITKTIEFEVEQKKVVALMLREHPDDKIGENLRLIIKLHIH